MSACIEHFDYASIHFAFSKEDENDCVERESGKVKRERDCGEMDAGKGEGGTGLWGKRAAGRRVRGG